MASTEAGTSPITARRTVRVHAMDALRAHVAPPVAALAVPAASAGADARPRVQPHAAPAGVQAEGVALGAGEGECDAVEVAGAEREHGGRVQMQERGEVAAGEEEVLEVGHGEVRGDAEVEFGGEVDEEKGL